MSARDPAVVTAQILGLVSSGYGPGDVAQAVRIGANTHRGRRALRRYLERHRRPDLWDWATANDRDRRRMKQGLTYSERVALAATNITLDGQVAHILDPTARRATVASNDNAVEYAWPTVKRVIKNGGHFTTRAPQQETP